MGKARNGEDYKERVDRKRKSWVSSERSMSVGSGVARMVESSSMSAIVEGTKLALQKGLGQGSELARLISFYVHL